MADEQNEVQKEEIVILEKDDGDITPLEDLDKKEEQVETPKPQKNLKKYFYNSSRKRCNSFNFVDCDYFITKKR
ncbi:BPTI domain-containing protein [Campylobacter fetus]|uniref:hypothetical protein n=1 Tax=Campylobacter fetus TaxID=196 RepID=UPI000AE7C60B|nr:hypothetical protein [Campylobacter fetus]